MLLVGWGRSALRANPLLPAAFPASTLAELKDDVEDEDVDERAAIMALVIFVQLY